MGTLDQGYAAALKGERLTATVASASAAQWADRGRTLTIATPFATKAAAEAEAARQLAFYAGPLVRDRAVVPGERRDLARRCIRLTGDLGYAATGEMVFVIGVQEQDNGTSVLTVLRRLG